MEPIRVLLVCGGGASSGFLANNMRKDAKKKNLAMSIMAKSESAINDFKDEIDVLLIGPHLQYMEEEIRQELDGTAVKIAVIDEMVYATLDGESANEVALRLVSEG